MTFPTDAELDEIEKVRETSPSVHWAILNRFKVQRLTSAARDRNRLEREIADLKDDYLRRHQDACDRAEKIWQMEREHKAALSDLRERCAKVAEQFPKSILIATAIRALPLTPEPDESSAPPSQQGEG